jgi:hypothetical protein
VDDGDENLCTYAVRDRTTLSALVSAALEKTS